jgi:hypothetical protein
MWMLAAHFLRADHLLLALLTAAISLALFIRHQWIARIVQFALVAGTIEWLRTSVILVLERQSLGQPWFRLASILGLVILLSVFSIFALESESMRKRYRCTGSIGERV